jgi:acetyl esterase/lipase
MSSGASTLSLVAAVTLLLGSSVSAAFTYNAYLPVRGDRRLLVPSFFASWLTMELAGHHLLWQMVVTAALVAFGALRHVVGWLGLAVSGASWLGLIVLIVQGRGSAQAMRDALSGVVTNWAGNRIAWWRLITPFPFRHPAVRRVRNVEYGRAGGRRLRLDIYEPRSPGARRPALMQIHGGAWIVGDKRDQGVPICTHMAAAGWVAFNVNYRLSPAATFPDHLIDLKRALVWIRAHADELGVDPDFIAVTGGSAGGHLTALMALTANDPRYQPGFETADTTLQAAVPFYAIFDFTNRLGTHPRGFFTQVLEPWVMKAFFSEEPERFRAASPLDHLHAGAPPFLVIHGDRDTLAPLADARLFVEELSRVSKSPVVYAELRGAQHAFDIFVSPRSVPVIEGVERFLSAIHAAHKAGALEKPTSEPEPEPLRSREAPEAVVDRV